MNGKSIREIELQNCVDLAAEFFREVMPRVRTLPLDGYDKHNRLVDMLDRLATRKVSRDA